MRRKLVDFVLKHGTAVLTLPDSSVYQWHVLQVVVLKNIRNKQVDWRYFSLNLTLRLFRDSKSTET